MEMEKRNEDGLNKNVYFVTSDLTLDWIELPDVKPEQLIASQKIKYMFTGNLKKQIITNPHFPGLEADLLRCQIARINHSCYAVPSTNHYKIPDTETPFKALEKDEEAKPLKINEIINLKNWIHFLPGILKEGRISHLERDAPEGIEPEDFKKLIISKDPFQKRLQNLSEDSNLESSIPKVKISPWKINLLYDDHIYINPNIKNDNEEEPKDNTVNYTLVNLKSLRWPGFNIVKFKTDIFYFYFGWGTKFSDPNFGEKFVFQDFPIIPLDVLDYEEIAEPNSPPQEIDPNNKEADNDKKEENLDEDDE